MINGKTYYSVKGVDCSSAVSFAWRTAAKKNDLPSYTDDFMKMTRKKKGSNSSSKKYLYDQSFAEGCYQAGRIKLYRWGRGI